MEKYTFDQDGGILHIEYVGYQEYQHVIDRVDSLV